MREHSFIQSLSVFFNSCELEESKLFEIKGGNEEQGSGNKTRRAFIHFDSSSMVLQLDKIFQMNLKSERIHNLNHLLMSGQARGHIY